MKKRKLIIAIAIVMILTIIILLYQTKLFENVKSTVNSLLAEEVEILQGPDMIVDITNIINDKYPEHEHVWYDEYDETNHWSKCSICKEVKDLAAHILTTTWALGRESCERENSYTKTCNCGYGVTGRKPCTWNGTWESLYVGYDYHDRRCASCGLNIYGRSYIDNTKGGILVPDKQEDMYTTGMLPEEQRCKLANGEFRPCGSQESCVICGGPRFRNSKHSYSVCNGKDIICRNCGSVRWNMRYKNIKCIRRKK